MAFFTDGVVPWNSLDDNIRAPTTAEKQNGYPCGEADRQLFNFTTAYPWGQVHNAILDAGLTPDDGDLTQLSQAIRDTMSAGALIGVQKFEASGTYTPSSGTRFIIVEAVGGGGAGGGCSTPTSGQVTGAGGGSGGNYMMARFDAGFDGASVVIGAGGAGSPGGTDGGDGGQTNFGGLLVVGGGLGGDAGTWVTNTTPYAVSGSGKRTPDVSSISGGQLLRYVVGGESDDGIIYGGGRKGGAGGSSMLGIGGGDAGGSGHSGSGYGAGSSGAAAASGDGPGASPDGSPGVVIIWEYA